MDKNERIQRIQEMTKGYTVFSLYTRLPYVECEKEELYDQAYLFESAEDAEAMGKEYFEEKIRLTLQELTTKDMPVCGTDGSVKTVKVNQIRQYLYLIRQLGVNAVCYKPLNEEATTIPLMEILPKELAKPLDPEVDKMTQIQLSGIYLAQELRRDPKEPNIDKLIELTNDYYETLVNSNILLPVMVPEGKEKEEYLNLGECQLPYVKSGEHTFLAVFTDPREVESYVQGQNPRVVPIPFSDIEKICPAACAGCMVNPMGFSLPLNKEDFRKIIEKHKK